MAKILAIKDHKNPTEGYSLLGMAVREYGYGQYRTFVSNFVSEYIRDVLLQKFVGVSLLEKAAILLSDDESNHKNPACNELFKEVVAELLISENGVEWAVREGLQCDSDETRVPMKWLPFERKLERCIRGTTPEFLDMEENVLYSPSDFDFPLVHHMFKCGDELAVFRVIRNCGNRDIVNSCSIKALIEKVGLPDTSKLRLYLISSPSVADTIMIDFNTSDSKTDSTPQGNDGSGFAALSYSVIRLPRGYCNAPVVSPPLL